MKLTSVDLVGRGANQEAHISLFKGLDANPTEGPHVEAPTISKSDPNRFDYIVEAFP
ncbi:MAG: hypothetical protein J6S21_01055 [Victivallales bacterium]|nr:hypothetical protein [Victivallales bacterium]